MEGAAFQPPLSEDYLKELGRLAVNCGFVEFLLNIHIGKLYQIKGTARHDLIAPLITKRKIEILTAGLCHIPNPEVRALVGEACKLTSPTISLRNELLHGIWGFTAEIGFDAVVVSTKKTEGQRGPGDITKCADDLAIASRKLADALIIDGGGMPPSKPERLVITP